MFHLRSALLTGNHGHVPAKGEHHQSLNQFSALQKAHQQKLEAEEAAAAAHPPTASFDGLLSVLCGYALSLYR